MNVLVLNPASTLTKNVIRDVLYGCWCNGKRIGGATTPPFGLLQIATILGELAPVVHTQFLDAQAEKLTEAMLLNDAKQWDAIILSTSTMSFTEDTALLTKIKTINPKIVTILFGSHPTFMPESSLSATCVDICVRHEPEMILKQLITLLAAGSDEWKHLDGLSFTETDTQKQVFNPTAAFYNLEDLPLPDVSLLPKGIEYFNPLVRRLPYITTTTSKGCPAKCTFCTAPYFDGMKVRFKSLEYMKREVLHYLHHGFKEIYFRDDTFFVDKRRDKAFCHWILNEHIDISWICNTRVATIHQDREMLELAKSAGCHTVKIGIESGDQSILDRLKKDYTLDEGNRVFKWLNEIGLCSHAHVMLGNPGETKQTVKKTLEYVLLLNPTTATFGICTPYPGTPLFDEVAQLCPEIKDGSSQNFSKLHVEGLFNEYFTELTRHELKYLVKWAYRKFYVRPSYLWNRLREMSDYYNIRRVSIAAANVLNYSYSSGS